jgi:hypothetical protein
MKFCELSEHEQRRAFINALRDGIRRYRRKGLELSLGPCMTLESLFIEFRKMENKYPGDWHPSSGSPGLAQEFKQAEPPAPVIRRSVVSKKKSKKRGERK